VEVPELHKWYHQLAPDVKLPAVRRRSHVRPGEMGYGEVCSCSSGGPCKCAVIDYGRGSEKVTACRFLPRPSAGIAGLSIATWLKNTLLVLEIIHLGKGSLGAEDQAKYCAPRRTLGTVLHCNFGAVSSCGPWVLNARPLRGRVDSGGSRAAPLLSRARAPVFGWIYASRRLRTSR
jgi:hypothetical protein